MSQEANSAFAVEDDELEDLFASSLESSEDNPNEQGFAALTGQAQEEPEPEPESEGDALDEVSFESEPEPTIVDPVAPERIDEENAVRIPDATGVEYVIGDEVFDGEVEFEDTLVITAYPSEGYAFSENTETEWTFEFTQEDLSQPEEEPEPELVEETPEPTVEEPEPEPEPEPVEEVQPQEPEVSPDAELNAIADNERFTPEASQAKNIKEGVDYNVSLETLEESIKILDVYRHLEDDEAEFAGKFIGLSPEVSEAEVVSSVLNADPLLFKVFDAIKEADTYEDPAEIAFYIVSLPRSVMQGVSYVAAQYLDAEPADESLERVPYARKIVTQIRELDGKALRLVDAAHNLIKGEMRDEDSEFANN